MSGLTVTATKKQLRTRPAGDGHRRQRHRGHRRQGPGDDRRGQHGTVGDRDPDQEQERRGRRRPPVRQQHHVAGLHQRAVTVSGGTGTNGSFKAIGIELTRDGQLTFDKTKFIAAFNADPVKTQALFIDSAEPDVTKKTGLADKLANVADVTTQTNTGTLSRLIISGNDAITDLNHRVDDWDVRLLARQATLQKQFGAMETALGKLKNQGNWLSGQLASLG